MTSFTAARAMMFKGDDGDDYHEGDDDVLEGGAGDDSLFDDDGINYLYGGDGEHTRYYGGDGDDEIYAQGKKIILTEAGYDIFHL